MTERSAFTFRNLVVIAVLGMLVLGGSAYFGLNFAVERAVEVDAEQKGRDWADYFIETMPGLEQLLVTGRLTAPQQAVVAAAESLGDARLRPLPGLSLRPACTRGGDCRLPARQYSAERATVVPASRRSGMKKRPGGARPVSPEGCRRRTSSRRVRVASR